MPTSADFAQERHELERVLASGIFNRAPNLAHLLTYVCSKYFEGTAEQIKEYNIAVDALGRPTDFDQKRDSIVRVEAHRLRKRLREYYDSDGADHPVRIEIPPGQYAPQFLAQSSPAPSLSPVAIVVQDEPPADGTPGAPDTDSVPALAPAVAVPAGVVLTAASPYRRAAVPLALLLVFCTGAIALWKVPTHKTSMAGVEAAGAASLAPGSDEIRILAGHIGGDYTDRLGRVWHSDRYFQGGRTFETSEHPIFGTREPRIYQSRREGAFEYAIPLAPGVYELRLHFAETLYGENNVAGGGESSRVFNVLINGREVLHEFDVINEAGPSAADVRAFKDLTPTGDGKLHLRFEPFTNPPLLCAIEITPGTAGRLKPIRMIALDRAYTDKYGRTWEPDRYAHGGQTVLRTRPVQDAPDPELFRGERFGNLRYVVPVPPGRYSLTLYAAEAWFGPGMPPGGGAGSRVFDILCNGVMLRRGFDIFKEARTAERATSFTAHGLEPDAQGKLNINLAPTRNYACVNALEILDESR
jgi:hypothetical protein